MKKNKQTCFYSPLVCEETCGDIYMEKFGYAMLIPERYIYIYDIIYIYIFAINCPNHSYILKVKIECPLKSL